MSWECPICTTVNADKYTFCDVCEVEKPESDQDAENIGVAYAMHAESWNIERNELENRIERLEAENARLGSEAFRDEMFEQSERQRHELIKELKDKDEALETIAREYWNDELPGIARDVLAKWSKK